MADYVLGTTAVARYSRPVRTLALEKGFIKFVRSSRSVKYTVANEKIIRSAAYLSFSPENNIIGSGKTYSNTPKYQYTTTNTASSYIQNEPEATFYDTTSSKYLNIGVWDDIPTTDSVVCFNLALTSTYDATIYAEPTLAHYYPLNELTGTTAYDTIGGLNGTYVGGVTLETRGIVGDAASSPTFDGSTGYVSIPGTLVDCTSPVTVEFWIKAGYPNPTGTEGLFSGNSSYYLGAYLQPFSYGPDLGQYIFGFGYIDDNLRTGFGSTYFESPHLLAFSFEPTGGNLGTFTYYRDGQLILSAPNIAVNPASGDSTFMQVNNYFTAGQMSKIAVYNGVLSANDVMAHYVAGGTSSVVRLTQVVTENLTYIEPNVRVNQVVSEALQLNDPEARIDHIVVEVLMKPGVYVYPVDTFEFSDSVYTFRNSTHSYNLSETFETSDSLVTESGSPGIVCPYPLICVNPQYTPPAQITFPTLPIQGYPIAYNVQNDHVSLIVNGVPNSQFPAALYVFYEKNQSVWYRFKELNESWSPETLLACANDAGIINSASIFDCAGYPITAFENAAGFIGIQYFIDGSPYVVTTTNQGTSPNVIVDGQRIILMWIPPNYSGSLYFSDSGDCFQKPCAYYVGVPGTMESFSLRQTTDTAWIFSFSSLVDGVSTVYHATT